MPQYWNYAASAIIIWSIAGVFYILWGIHALDFYFLKMNPTLVQWGLPIGTIAATGGAFGMLYYYFDRKNKELLRIEEELKYTSLHDSLTGLFNRNCFEEEIKRREKEKRTGKDCPPTGIMICDVDGLRLINDTLGHEQGNEFAVLMDEDEEGLARAYQYIRQALHQYNAGNPELPLSISVGYAVDHDSPDLTPGIQGSGQQHVPRKGEAASGDLAFHQ